jgi:hypothetical protein
VFMFGWLQEGRFISNCFLLFFMYSLSDCVSIFIEGQTLGNKTEGIDFEVDLDDGMPSCFEKEIDEDISDMLSGVTLEAKDARARKIRYQTSYDPDANVQILRVSHNGTHVPERALNWTRERLVEIAEGTAEHFDRHGNLLAARAVAPLGGRLTLENNVSGEYRVTTTVTIPHESL